MRFARKVVCMALCGIMVLGMVPMAHAANAADIYINGELFTYDTVEYGEVTVYQNRLYVPLRVTAERLGYKVDFVDGNKATVDGPKGKVVVDLSNLDSKTLAVGGEVVTLDVPVARLIENRTMVAARGFATSLNCEVTWDGAAHINTDEAKTTVESGNGIKNIIAEEDFDPSSMKDTLALGEKLASEWTLGRAKCGAGEAAISLSLKNDSTLSTSSATIKWSDGILIDASYSKPTAWPSIGPFVDQALKELTSNEIRVKVMAIFNDLAERYATDGVDKAREWYYENADGLGFKLPNNYFMVFGATGVRILENKGLVAESNIRDNWSWFNEANKM